MTKQGRKRNGKKNMELRRGEGGGNNVPQTEAELPGVHRHNSSGSTVDLAFFRTSGQLYGELHQCLSRGSVEDYTDENISKTGRQVLLALDGSAEAADPRSDSKSSCPFVMLLSMLLPTLRKYLAWTQATRQLWGSNFASLRHHSTTSDGAIYRGEYDTMLWAMLAQHDMLTRCSLQTAHILRLIEGNECVDHESAHSKRSTHQSKVPKTTSQASSGSSACSSVTSTPRDSIDTVTHTPRITRSSDPQVYHITLELTNIDAEFKVYLADLTETILEVVEMIAKHMCTPTASKDGGRTRISAREFVERLVQHLLEPMGQRMLAEPSASYLDLFPRLLEQCITVTIDNFARDSGNRNELQAAPFEAGVMHLRTWSFKLEIEYNTLMRSQSSSSTFTDSSTDTDVSDSAALKPVSATTNRLDLMTLGGFKRLEVILSSWLNAASTATGQELGSGTSARSWGVSSLTGGIRSTLVRTFSGRATPV